MQNLDKSTARIECWNYLRDEKSTESPEKLFQTLRTRSVKNADLTILLQCRLNILLGWPRVLLSRNSKKTCQQIQQWSNLHTLLNTKFNIMLGGNPCPSLSQHTLHIITTCISHTYYILYCQYAYNNTFDIKITNPITTQKRTSEV